MMKFFIGLLLFTSVSFAQTLLRGPYLQIGTPNSIVIRWRTDTDTESRVRYGVDSTNLDHWVDSLSLKSEHEVTLTSLLPNTQYYYSAETTTAVLSSGPDNYFITAPPVGAKKKTRIWILGDSGTANANANAVKEAYYDFTDTTHTNLWVMLGDNAYVRGTDAEYQAAVFEMYPAMLKKSVLWPAFGNHDGVSANSNTQTGVFYDIFTLPKNAEAGGYPSGTEAYYSFDYANIHFICLNSHDIDRSVGGQMCSWLQNDLSATNQDWVIAYWHHPAYTKGSHNSDTEGQLIEMRENVLPILEQGGADLVFYGHSHSYERSYLLDGHYGYSWELTMEMILDSGDGREDGDGAYTKPSSSLAPHEGIVSFTAGSSGKTGGGSLNHPAMYISYNELGSVILDIEGSRADVTFLDNNGINLDYLTLYKGPPIWSDIPDTTFYEDTNLLINLNDYVYDDGDPDSTLIIIINGGDQINSDFDSSSHTLNFSTTPNSSGFTEYFIALVTDPWGATDIDTFSVSVLPVNDAPVITLIDSQIVDEDDALEIIVDASDVDGDTLLYITNSDTNSVMVSLVGTELTIIPVTDWNGSATITVNVSDGILSDSVSFVLTVVPVNDAPSSFTLNEQDSIYITMDNFDSDSIVFTWDESEDVESDELIYHITTELFINGQLTTEYDTTLTDNVMKIDYKSVFDEIYAAQTMLAGIEWDVSVSDGTAEVLAENGPLTVGINASDAVLTISEELLPEVFALYQNYPNPFNPVTTLRYDLPENSFVNIAIYDLVGREVRTLVNHTQDAGFKSVIWDATNDYGKSISTGIYFYQIHAGGFVQTKKLVLLK